MKLVPIPPQHLDATSAIWGPFLENIAKRGRCHIRQRLDDLYSGLVMPIIVWDENEKQAKALVGVSIIQRGEDKVARIVWLTGIDRASWLSLNDELEQMFRSQGCAGMEAFARPGWTRELRRLGYRLTHVHYEKDFTRNAQQ